MSIVNHSLNANPTMMTPAGLILALGTFFKVDTILVCLKESPDDQCIQNWHEFGKSLTGKRFHTYSSDELNINLAPDDDDVTLILLEDAGCYQDLVEMFGLALNVVWLIPPDSEMETPEVLRLDSLWITLEHSANDNDTLDMVEHYGVAETKKFFNNIGSWNDQNGLNITQPDIWERRNNLDGINLINAVNLFDLVTNFDNEHHNTSGFMPEVLENLMWRMNFTSTSVRPPDGEWGVVKTYENGTKYWSGIVGELVAHRAHMSTSGLSVVAHRGEAIDYTVGVLPEAMTVNIGSQTISTGHINTMAFIKVLAGATWAAIFLIAGVFGACQAAIKVTHDGIPPNKLSCFIFGVAYFGNMLMRLHVALKSILSHKMLFLSASIVAFFVFESYVAQLTAKMTVGSPRTQLRSFQDIIDNEITIMVVPGTSMDLYFQTAPEGTARYEVNKHYIDRETRRELSKTEATLKMKEDSKLAHFGVTIGFAKYDYITTLTDFDGKLEGVIAIGLQKNSEFKAAFDYHIMDMKQSGVLHEIYNMWIESDETDDMTDRIFVQDAFSLGFDNLFLPAIIVALGILASLTVVVFEKLFFEKNSVNNGRTKRSSSNASQEYLYYKRGGEMELY